MAPQTILSSLDQKSHWKIYPFENGGQKPDKLTWRPTQVNSTENSTIEAAHWYRRS